jgi:putative redox protein
MAAARVKWIEDQTLLGVDANGKATIMSSSDGPGISPMQMLLLGLAGCTIIDVVGILQKQRQPFGGLEIMVDGAREEQHPRLWKTIHLHYIIEGAGLDARKIERAIALSVEKYCGAHATLAGVATITHDFEIRDRQGREA